MKRRVFFSTGLITAASLASPFSVTAQQATPGPCEADVVPDTAPDLIWQGAGDSDLNELWLRAGSLTVRASLSKAGRVILHAADGSSVTVASSRAGSQDSTTELEVDGGAGYQFEIEFYGSPGDWVLTINQ